MCIANKCVATSAQRLMLDLMGAGSKGDCFVFDLFKNRISQLENEIAKKDEMISFITEQSSISSNSLQIQNQERRSVNNNPLNDSIESKEQEARIHLN